MNCSEIDLCFPFPSRAFTCNYGKCNATSQRHLFTDTYPQKTFNSEYKVCLHLEAAVTEAGVLHVTTTSNIQGAISEQFARVVSVA